MTYHLLETKVFNSDNPLGAAIQFELDCFDPHTLVSLPSPVYPDGRFRGSRLLFSDETGSKPQFVLNVVSPRGDTKSQAITIHGPTRLIITKIASRSELEKIYAQSGYARSNIPIRFEKGDGETILRRLAETGLALPITPDMLEQKLLAVQPEISTRSPG